MDNPYKILQVDSSASQEVIKAAYRALIKSKDNHPDLGGDVKTAQKLNGAYSLLSHPESRRKVDAELNRNQTQGGWEKKTLTPLMVVCLHCGSVNSVPFRSFIYNSSCGQCRNPFYEKLSKKKQPKTTTNFRTGTENWGEKPQNQPKSKSPSNPFKVAVFLYERHLFVRATEQLYEILNQDEKNAEALHLLGMCFYRLLRFEDAVQQFGKSVQVTPDHFLSHLYLGKALMRLKNYNQAVFYLKKASQQQPQNEKLVLLLANCYFMSSQYEESAEHFGQVVQLDPKNANSLFLMGMSYFKTKNYSKAFESFRKGRSFFPENPKFDRMLKTTVNLMT